jgi:septal ring factor EnvC (AmiA/AmiB activator)
VRVRPLLIATAIVSSALGAIVVYLVLTVPNDVQAGALLKQARQDLAARHTDRAKESLSKIVQQYPRTDAAAAATVALVKIGDEELDRLQRQIDALRRDHDKQSSTVKQLQDTIDEVKNAPPKVIVQAPAARQTVKKSAPTRRVNPARRQSRPHL